MEAGRVLGGRYELVAPIGVGGMASVWRAMDTVLGREVAVKVLHAQYASNESAVERFRREARAAAMLKNANVVATYDWGTDADGTCYLVMELVEGQSLADIIERGGALDSREVARIGSRIAEGLAEAHSKGIVHRDVKPQNVMILADGGVKVMDFGIASVHDATRLTVADSVVGTASYASPEQLKAQGNVTPLSDVYSLGVTMYEAACGRVPFEGESIMSVMMMQINSDPPRPSSINPSCDAQLEAIILRCMQKDPEARWGSVRELRRALDAYLEGQPVSGGTYTGTTGGTPYVAPAAAAGTGAANATRAVGAPAQNAQYARQAAAAQAQPYANQAQAGGTRYYARPVQQQAVQAQPYANQPYVPQQAQPKKSSITRRVAIGLGVAAVAGAGVAALVATGALDRLLGDAEDAVSDVQDAVVGEDVEPQQEVRDSVEDYSWTELQAISQEMTSCTSEAKALELAEHYNLVGSGGTLDGSQKKAVELSDGNVTYAQVCGFYHDDRGDNTGRAGITFILEDAIANQPMNDSATNDGGWEGSAMRDWLADDGLALLPSELQSVIAAVYKNTNNTGKTNDASDVTRTTDKLWLFSLVELAGDTGVPATDAEGSQYQLFADQGVEYANYATAHDVLARTALATSGDGYWAAGEECVWWERTPLSSGSEYFLYVDKEGELDNGYEADCAYGVVPGFCI